MSYDRAIRLVNTYLNGQGGIFAQLMGGSELEKQLEIDFGPQKEQYRIYIIPFGQIEHDKNDFLPVSITYLMQMIDDSSSKHTITNRDLCIHIIQIISSIATKYDLENLDIIENYHLCKAFDKGHMYLTMVHEDDERPEFSLRLLNALEYDELLDEGYDPEVIDEMDLGRWLCYFKACESKDYFLDLFKIYSLIQDEQLTIEI